MGKTEKSVNSKVDNSIRLVEIPGLNAKDQACWQIRALEINGKSPALAALIEWQKKEPEDWKKIRKVMQLHGSQRVIQDERKIKKSSNPNHGEVYEMRADKGHARLMFFYDTLGGTIIICTNEYWKGKGNQDAAFATCKRLKDYYLSQRKKNP